jgi:rod shape-determining protein MreD
MRYIAAALLLLLMALVQTSVMPAFPVFGVAPNLVLALAVCWTIVRGRAEAMVVVPMAGVFLGIFGSQPLGVSMLAIMPVVLFAEVHALRLTPSNFLLTVAIVFLSSIVYEMVLLVALRLQGESAGWLPAFIRVVVPTGIVSVLFTPPVYWLVRSRSEGQRRIRAYV